jgi:DNA-binding transcriptional LysR family regulator
MFCLVILDNVAVETRRLEYLAELSRQGSMRAVADVLGTTTSTVSQQLAVLAREVGAALIEPQGRRVRLTPEGRRLAEHAVSILAAVEAAYRDLEPGAEPGGMLRVAGFGLATRSYLLPIIAQLAASHPRVRVLIREHEPAEALDLLAADQVDAALTYDYNLAPAAVDPAMRSLPLWTARWGLGVPAHVCGDDGTAFALTLPGVSAPEVAPAQVTRPGVARPGVTGPHATRPGLTALEVFGRFRGYDWIGNSRNTADEDVIRTLASMAGFTPHITHQADSLDLVQDMIAAGLGVGLLPSGYPIDRRVRLIPLTDPRVELRAYLVARQGRENWPPLALVTRLLQEASQRSADHGGHTDGDPA